MARVVARVPVPRLGDEAETTVEMPSAPDLRRTAADSSISPSAGTTTGSKRTVQAMPLSWPGSSTSWPRSGPSEPAVARTCRLRSCTAATVTRRAATSGSRPWTAGGNVGAGEGTRAVDALDVLGDGPAHLHRVRHRDSPPVNPMRSDLRNACPSWRNARRVSVATSRRALQGPADGSAPLRSVSSTWTLWTLRLAMSTSASGTSTSRPRYTTPRSWACRQVHRATEDAVYLKCWDEEDHHSLRMRHNPRTGTRGLFTFRVEARGRPARLREEGRGLRTDPTTRG